MGLGTPGSKSLSLDLIEEVASGDGVSPLDPPPLTDSIESETFASLTSPESEPLSLRFTYCGEREARASRLAADLVTIRRKQVST